MRKKEGISIRDISNISGYSIATVSRVINNTGRVSDETRAKIRRIMQETGYVPDLVGKGLRTNITALIGIIVPDILVETFAEMIRHVQRQLQSMGIMTSVCVTDNTSETAQSYVDMLRSQRASGIIYVPEYNSTGISTYGLPVVYTFLLPPWETGENSCAVISDRRGGGYLATRALLDEGCRNIGIFYEQRWYAADAYLGYADALRERGLPINPKNEIYTHALYTSRARELTRELLKGDFPFDGLVATSPRITIGVLSALLESGRRIPDDIRLVGFGGIRARDYGLLQLPLVREPVPAMAKAAVDSLLAMIDGKAPVEKRQVFPVELLDTPN